MFASRKLETACDLPRYEREFADRHLVHGAVARWAAEKPHDTAFIAASTGAETDWLTFQQNASTLAVELLRLGFRKGDFLAVSLPLLPELLFLEYACFQIGVVPVPLDLRLSVDDVLRSLAQVAARGYAFPGQTARGDFRELGRAVRRHCPGIEHLFQFSAPEDVIEGAECFAQVAARASRAADGGGSRQALEEARAQVSPEDGALVIFTTGSTGSPKPALLSHRNITCQTLCFGSALLEESGDARTLVNLPPSHVGCQTETLMSTLFFGGTCILLEAFDPAASLEAIEKYRVTLLGQVPAMFQLEWRLPDYGRYDLTSLRTVGYGGQMVTAAFLERMACMAPRVATGMGLTEAAGFCSYAVTTAEHAGELATGMGFAAPLYPMSIRQPMREDGVAGAELPDGELGHLCFRGPQTFLGYIGNAEATARTVSREGWLYTGDLGSRDERGLHLAGRTKWVIKPLGYQVFPADVEDWICRLSGKVAACGVVGAPHETATEAIVAFVEKKPGVELSAAELEQHAGGLTSYMRPRHYVVLESGQLPLNRMAKTDYVKLSEWAGEEVKRLRARGGWE